MGNQNLDLWMVGAISFAVFLITFYGNALLF